MTALGYACAYFSAAKTAAVLRPSCWRALHARGPVVVEASRPGPWAMTCHRARPSRSRWRRGRPGRPSGVPGRGRAWRLVDAGSTMRTYSEAARQAWGPRARGRGEAAMMILGWVLSTVVPAACARRRELALRGHGDGDVRPCNRVFGKSPGNGARRYGRCWAPMGAAC